MNFFYCYFLLSYVLYSTIGLIVDIFFDEKRINKMDINLIKHTYSNVYNNVSKNILLVSIPFFVIAELMYVNYTPCDSILTYVYQYILTIILGLNLDYLIHIFKHSKWFYKYHKQHHNSTEIFGFMCYDTHIYDFCLSMIVVILPALFRFHPQITNIWIILYLYNNMIINYYNMSILGIHYNIHHKFIHYNYGFIIIDSLLDTHSGFINTSNDFEKNDNEPNDNEPNDNEPNDNEPNDIEPNDIEPNDNEKLENTNESNVESNKDIKKDLFGQLHYSNFF